MNWQSRSILNKAIEHLDITLATLGCILSIPLTVYLQVAIQRPIYPTVGIVTFLACLAYLIAKRKSLPSLEVRVETRPRLYLLLNILFFCLLIFSMVSLHLRADLYTRPLSYFISIALMVAVLAVELLFLPTRKSATYFALFKIILIGLSLEWSELIIFPNVVGDDPWWHQMVVSEMLGSGHMPEGYAYSKLPCFHLMIGATSLVTDLSYKMATMFSICLLQVMCDTLFIFLLGRFIHSAKAGLLAALFLIVANWHIHFGYIATPNTMAVTMIPIVIYLLFKLRREKPIASICLSAIFMAVLILTHTIGALCLAMLLFLIWLGFQIYRRLRYQAMATARIFLVAFILFTGATLSYWTFVSGHIHTLTSLAQTGFSGEYFGTLPPEEVTLPPEEVTLPPEEVTPPPEEVTPPPEAVTPPPGELPPMSVAIAQYRDSIPFAEGLFNNLGFFLFFAFAFIGCFAMFSKKMRNRYGFALVVAGLVILAINFFGIITHRGFISGRWNYFSQILLAIPVGIAFFWLGSLPRRKIGNACLVGMMAFLLSFLMIMSPAANWDNRTFSPHTIIRAAFTESELEAMGTISNIYDGEIITDLYSMRPLQFLTSNGNIHSVDKEIITQDYSDCRDSLVLIREEITRYPFGCRPGIYKLPYNLTEALRKQGFSEVYNCGSVSAFVWNGD